ncbi:hypothetical protein OLZ31_26415, partial [Enterobacter asburiae]|nr:hypothetical protein [Enterobacter asburiae]
MQKGIKFEMGASKGASHLKNTEKIFNIKAIEPVVSFRVRAPLFKEPSLWLGFCFSAFINPFFSILVSLCRGIVRSAMPGGAALTGPTGFVGRIRRSRHPACFLTC